MTINVVDVFEKAIQLARASAWQSDGLVNAAMAALDTAIELPEPPNTPHDSGLDLGGSTAGIGDDSDPPFGFDRLAAPKPPQSAKTAEIDVLDAPAWADLPTPGKVSVTATAVGNPPDPPSAPPLDLTLATATPLPWDPPSPPEFLPISPIACPPLAIDTTADFPEPDLDLSFDDRAFAEAFERALGALPGVAMDRSDRLLALLPAWAESVRAALQASVQEQVTGLSAAVGQRIDDHLRACTEIERRRLDAIAQRPLESGWGVPPAVAEALRQRGARDGTALGIQTESAIATKAAEAALRHRQFALDLYAKFRQSALELKLQEMQLLTRAVAFACRYAKAQAAAALEAARGRTLKQEADYQRVALRLQRSEAELEITLAQQMLVRAQIAVEAAQLTLTDAQTEQMAHEEERLQNLSEAYSAEVAGLKIDLRRRELSVEKYSVQAQAVGARAILREAQVQDLQAELAHDVTQQRVELKRLAYYEKQVKTLEERIALMERVDSANQTRSRLILDEYKQRVHEALFPAKMADMKNTYDLHAYKTQVAQFIEAKGLEIKRTEFEIDALSEAKTLKENAQELYRDTVREAAEMELSRLEALARAYLDAAGVMAGMSEAAASSINTLTDSMFAQIS